MLGMFAGDGILDFVGEAAGFPSENQDIIIAIPKITVAVRTEFAEKENTTHGMSSAKVQESIPVVMQLQIDLVPVIQTGSLHGGFIERKRGLTDNVHPIAAADAQAGNVPGIGGNFRAVEGDFHENPVFRAGGARAMVFRNSEEAKKMSAEVEEMEIREFLRDSGIEESPRIETLRAEASPRRYYRLGLKNGRTMILCCRPATPQSLSDDFIVITRNLAEAGIPVPEIHGRNESGTLLLLSDGGPSDLSTELRESLNVANQLKTESLLGEALKLLGRLHNIRPFTPVKERAFDKEKLSWELSFLRGRLEQLRQREPAVVIPPEDFWSELNGMCEILSEARPRVFTHRDYHGRNIMVRESVNAGFEFMLLDYQDARMGLSCYDLCSLLLDPYTELSRGRMEWGIAVYEAERSADIAVDRKLFFLQGLQRLLKALGTYLHLGFERGFIAYRESIGPALERIEWMLEEAPLSKETDDMARRMGESLLTVLERRRSGE